MFRFAVCCMVAVLCSVFLTVHIMRYTAAVLIAVTLILLLALALGVFVGANIMQTEQEKLNKTTELATVSNLKLNAVAYNFHRNFIYTIYE